MEKCTEKNEISDTILAFDAFTTNNHMKILKMLLPFVDSKHQKLLTVYIKWQEFIFTMKFFKYYSVNLYSADFVKKQNLDVKNIIPQVLPYCTDNEKQLLMQFNQMQNMMQMMEGIQEYLPFIQQFMSSDTDNGNPLDGIGNLNNMNIMDMLKNMLSEEQLSMFSMFMDNNDS